MNDKDKPLPKAKREPSAELRQAASAMREIFIALTDEDFTEAQALQILGAMLVAQGNSGS